MFGAGRKRDAVWAWFEEIPAKFRKKGNKAKCKDCGVQKQGSVARMKNHKSVGKCNILKDVLDDENIHFCQDTEENINQVTDGAQTSQSSVEKTEPSQPNVEKASSLCSYKKAVARASSGKTVGTKLDSYLIKTQNLKKKQLMSR